MTRRIIAAALAIAAFAALATPALAAKGGNGTGTSSTPPSDITLNGPAYFGATVSFTVTDPPTKWLPEMSVSCSQNGQTVYLGVQMLSGSSPYSPQFTLWSDAWAANGGGSANCSADLFYYTWKGQTETGVVYLAHRDFVAAAA
jgi:hypothetical protein